MKDNKEIISVITRITRKEVKGISYISLMFQTGKMYEWLDRTKFNPTSCFVSLWEEANEGDEVKILYRQDELQAVYLLKLLEEQEH